MDNTELIKENMKLYNDLKELKTINIDQTLTIDKNNLVVENLQSKVESLNTIINSLRTQLQEFTTVKDGD